MIDIDKDTKLECFDYDFGRTVHNIIAPMKLTIRIYFRIKRKKDYLEDLGDIEGHYIKMLYNEIELRHLLKERNDNTWFYNLRSNTMYFSTLDYDPQYLFKKGETTPGKRSGIIYIPTKEQLWDLLGKFTQTDFIIWKEENDIINSIHYHSPAANFLKFFMEKKFNAVWRRNKGYWKRKEREEFRINDYITLKLKHGQTQIYVKGTLFNQCKYLLINIPTDKVRDYDEIDSIDEASSLYSNDHETRKVKIPPKTEFWGHCSNIQAWYENDYDTRILHSNLSFPLLRELVNVGDPLAKRRFKEEIVYRTERGTPSTFSFLLHGGYYDHFTREELHVLSSTLLNINQSLISFTLKNYHILKKHKFITSLIHPYIFQFIKVKSNHIGEYYGVAGIHKRYDQLLISDIKNYQWSSNNNEPITTSRTIHYKLYNKTKKKKSFKINKETIKNLTIIESFTTEYYLFSTESNTLIIINKEWVDICLKLMNTEAHLIPNYKDSILHNDSITFFIKTFMLDLNLLNKSVVDLSLLFNARNYFKNIKYVIHGAEIQKQKGMKRELKYLIS